MQDRRAAHSRARVGQPCQGATLDGRHSDAQWLQMLILRGATRPTTRCDCRISCQMRGCKCSVAACLLAPCPVLIRLARWLPSHVRMHICSPWYISICSLLPGQAGLPGLSLCHPSGFPLLLLWTPLCSCHLDWSPLAACSLRLSATPRWQVFDGNITQVPAPWFPHGRVRQTEFGHLMAEPHGQCHC